MRPEGVAISSYADTNAPLWPGTARYKVARLIGQGGMGVVYEAFDVELGRAVALKTLPYFDADGLYRFKQEFRTLADVQHTNLVRLYELVAPEAGRIFFTMELVYGSDFARHVRSFDDSGILPPKEELVTTTQRPRASERPPALRSPEPSPRAASDLSPATVERLRRAARQLVQGVFALHAAGKVHRDLKPSNVLVTPEERVVILDFGVATEVAREGRRSSIDDGALVGTACYMAPELADENDGPGPAADWYSVGVMLYEALVGRPPFEGSMADVLARKIALDPIPPAACAEGVPADLDALCMALLRREAALRPTGSEILRWVGASRSSAPPAVPAADDDRAGLVGREGQLEALREAFAAVRSGRTVTVRVGGESGMGKSATVARFIDDLDRDGQAIVLRGRAYEREAVPYKAVDAVVDALSRHLLRPREGDAPPISLPDEMWALSRLFPVLQRVPGAAARGDVMLEDGHVLRRRAFGALRSLLGTLARRAPVVVFIDDAQWGDVDSVPLLAEVLRPPDAPAILVVMTYRSDESETSPFLRELGLRWPHGAEIRDVAIGPLASDDAQRLALTLLESTDETAIRTARAIAREARGSPFLIEELVRSHRRDTSDDAPSFVPVTLEEMVVQRLEKLSEDVRSLVGVVAVGGRPLSPRVLVAASGLGESIEAVLAARPVQRFLRSRLRDGQELVEVVHDRIRETVVGLLSEDALRDHHRRLAVALEAEPEADLEALAAHMLGAGDRRRGAQCAERAAEQAASKLAFDQAARLFRLALESHDGSEGDAQRLRVRLAQVLQGAGRAEESAEAYRSAAERAVGMHRLELQRSSAEQLLVSGRIEEGDLALRQVLAVVGMSAPRTPLGAVVWLIVYEVWGWLQGSRFRERDSDQVSLENRVRVDALRAVSVGLGLVDVVVGASMVTRHLVTVRRIGDRRQVLRAMCLELVKIAATRNRQSRGELRMIEAARGMATRIGPESEHYFAATSALALYLRGRYREALAGLDAVDVPLRQFLERSGSANVPLCATYCCFFLGMLREVARRVRPLLEDAEDRGDTYTAVSLRSTVMVDIALAADDIDAASSHVREAMAGWPNRGFYVQHWYAMLSEANIALYSGRGAEARSRLQRDARALRKSFLWASTFVRGMTTFVRASAAIGSIGDDPPSRAARVRDARRLARRLERENSPWTPTLACLARAAAANAEGERAEAEHALRSAVASVETSGMRLHGWIASHRLGTLIGGDEGAAIVRDAEDAMTAEGVRSPSRMAGMFLPGTWSAR